MKLIKTDILMPEEFVSTLERMIEHYEMILAKYEYQLHDDNRWLSIVLSEIGELCQKTRDAKSSQEYTSELQGELTGIIAALFCWMNAIEKRTNTDHRRNFNTTQDAEHSTSYTAEG